MIGKKGILSIAGILAVVAASLPLLGEDNGVFLKWWLLLLLLGVGFYPLTGRLFAAFADKGWLFSKAVGTAVSGFLVWVLVCAGQLKFTAPAVLGVTAAAMAACWMFSGLYRKKSGKRTGLPKSWDLILGEELLFLLLFFVWTYLAGFHPEAHGTEKFMDYGFMAAMMRSESLPAPDIWYSLEDINYYYGGQYYAVFLTKLSFSRVEDTYNLMRTLTAGLLGAMSFSIVFQMLCEMRRRREGRLWKAAPVFGGLLASGAVVFAGNMHYLIYGVLGKALGWEKGTGYWFPNSTRYIGYNPVTDDKCIHEFPCYSFVLGDLHAHVVNTMFVALMLGLMLAWVLHARALAEAEDGRGRRFRAGELLASPYVLAGGWLTGLFQFTNYWDFVIYITVFVICAVYVNLQRFGGRWRFALGGAALQAAEAFLAGTVTALPFTLSFDTMVSGVALAQNHTPLYQWLVLWGLPAALVLIFTVLLAVKYGRHRRLWAKVSGAGTEKSGNGETPLPVSGEEETRKAAGKRSVSAEAHAGEEDGRALCADVKAQRISGIFAEAVTEPETRPENGTGSREPEAAEETHGKALSGPGQKGAAEGEEKPEGGERPEERKEPESGERPGGRKEPESGERPEGRKEPEDKERPEERKELEGEERPEEGKTPEREERPEGRTEPESGKRPEGRKEPEDKERPEERKEPESGERPEGRKGPEDKERSEERKEPEGEERPEERKAPEREERPEGRKELEDKERPEGRKELEDKERPEERKEPEGEERPEERKASEREKRPEGKERPEERKAREREERPEEGKEPESGERLEGKERPEKRKKDTAELRMVSEPAAGIEGEKTPERMPEKGTAAPGEGAEPQEEKRNESAAGEREADGEAKPGRRRQEGEESRQIKPEGDPVSGFLLWNCVPDTFAFILGMCALGLVLIPEIVYVRDIYENGYARSNTMFKLTYQGFILFGIAMAYIVTRLLLWKKRRLAKAAGGIGLLLLLATFGYFGNAVSSWFGSVWKPEEYRGLDATRYLETVYPEDAGAIRWLNAYVEGNPVVLEANGDSYSNYERVSAMTGLPTVLGWYVHEWLWRGDTYELNMRSVDIETIYTSDDSELVSSLLEKYDVSYIFVGSCEREKYGQIREELLAGLGEVVYGAGPGSGGTYVIKLDRAQ